MYEKLDEILDNFNPKELAEYIYMNDIEYSNKLEFHLRVCHLEYAGEIVGCNDEHPLQTYIDLDEE